MGLGCGRRARFRSWVCGCFIAFSNDQVHILDPGSNLINGQFPGELADAGDLAGGGQDDVLAAGLGMAPAILAGNVNVEIGMEMVLDGGDAVAMLPEQRDQFLDEGGFAAAGFADEGEDGDGHGDDFKPSGGICGIFAIFCLLECVINAGFDLVICAGCWVGHPPAQAGDTCSPGGEVDPGGSVCPDGRSGGFSGGKSAGDAEFGQFGLSGSGADRRGGDGQYSGGAGTVPHLRREAALMKFSLVLLGLFMLGVVFGTTGFAPQFLLIDGVSMQLVRVLLLLVGLGMGLDPQFFTYLRHVNLRMLLVPSGVALGSLLGAGLVALVLPGLSVRDGAAVGAGMGYYSLSSILIGQVRGAELGVVALISNILREVSTLLLAPLLVRVGGKLAPIASAGATSSDTTLPVIQRYTDSATTLIAVVNGLVLTLLVPISGYISVVRFVFGD